MPVNIHMSDAFIAVDAEDIYVLGVCGKEDKRWLVEIFSAPPFWQVNVEIHDSNLLYLIGRFYASSHQSPMISDWNTLPHHKTGGIVPIVSIDPQKVFIVTFGRKLDIGIID